PPPAIAVTPVKAEYLIGDTVSIRCVAPGSSEKMEGFQFWGTGGWAAHVRTAKRTYVYSFNVTGPKEGGAQVCAYAVTDRFRQTRRSRESKAVVISVRDRPPPPALALAAPGPVIEGQPLVFLCTAPAGVGERRFRFYKGGGEIGAGEEAIWGEAEGRLRLTESRRNHTGNFTCAYEEETQGRWIRSYPSRAAEVLVKGAAPAPRLGVEPAGGLASEGYPLGLTCAAPRADFGMRFRFYRNGAELPPDRGDSQRETVGNVARLRFPRSPGGFGGRFTCRVEEKAGGVWVPSPPSQAVDVIVKGKAPPPP
ncbi:UNVERIFIED_CONTAM: Immunoglobulin superfamily member 1, partial [Eudyptes robustus]